ncbi:hypothetical protein Tco_0243168 [Tanacetum coccineum]
MSKNGFDGTEIICVLAGQLITVAAMADPRVVFGLALIFADLSLIGIDKIVPILSVSVGYGIPELPDFFADTEDENDGLILTSQYEWILAFKTKKQTRLSHSQVKPETTKFVNFSRPNWHFRAVMWFQPLVPIPLTRMNEMIMYPRVDISEITYVTVKKEVNDSVLRWALRSSGGALIVLHHVHQPAGQNSWNANT